jgi:hypothetical protein
MPIETTPIVVSGRTLAAIGASIIQARAEAVGAPSALRIGSSERNWVNWLSLGVPLPDWKWAGRSDEFGDTLCLGFIAASDCKPLCLKEVGNA